MTVTAKKISPWRTLEQRHDDRKVERAVVLTQEDSP